MNTKKILLCNDDGYRATGLLTLFEALSQTMGLAVEVIAPEINNSAKSNALTLHTPLYLETAMHLGNGFRYINGTPADCMHIALTGLLGYTPDLVVSGINNGANMGDDVIYSGTVGAAMEGHLFGIPAVAFSQVESGWKNIDAAAQKAVDIVQLLLNKIERKTTNTHNINNHNPLLWNVNIPNLPYHQLNTTIMTKLGRRCNAMPAITQTSPNGKIMYWIGAAGPARSTSLLPGSGTDFAATAQGHVSITPLQVDLTNHGILNGMV